MDALDDGGSEEEEEEVGELVVAKAGVAAAMQRSDLQRARHPSMQHLTTHGVGQVIRAQSLVEPTNSLFLHHLRDGC